MKKILFIVWSHSLGGGAEALLTAIVNHLDTEKYQIGIIEVYHSCIKKEPINSNIIIYDPITFEGDAEYQKKLYYIHREPEKMIRKYIPSGYDLYVSFNYQIPSFLLPEGTRNIAWIHGAIYDLAKEGMEAYRCLQRNAFDKAMNIISISDITTASIKNLFPECVDKIVEIYNAVDIKKVREKADSKPEIELEHPAIVCVGRLDDNKDPLRMLDIFDEAFQKNNCLHLYFLGKGELESRVREKAYEYGLNGHVHFLGYLENPFPVIKQADLCGMSSKSEGFPMSLLESVALNVPFISTEVGGARILADRGSCGRVYKTNGEAAKYIVELLDIPKDMIQKDCKESISRFDFNVYIAKIEKLFDEVLRVNMGLSCEQIGNEAEEENKLEDRVYYYRFPDGFIPNGAKVILYGAGNIGTNYYNYIKATDCCKVVAWVDAAVEKYRNIGKKIENIEEVIDLEYDIILISVMSESVAQLIHNDLRKKGIDKRKIMWTKPIF